MHTTANIPAHPASTKGVAAAIAGRPGKTTRRGMRVAGPASLRRRAVLRAGMLAAPLAAVCAAALAGSASAAPGDHPVSLQAAGHSVRAAIVNGSTPKTEISCTMSFTQSNYFYGATPSQILTTFSWGSSGTLPIDCRGTVNGLTIDSARKSRFEEHGTETATCTQGAGYALATLTVPTIGAGSRTLTMPLENTFTGTTFDIAATDTLTGLGALGSWVLPSSNAPCPATNPGPIPSIEVAHAFQIYSLSL